MKRILLTLFAFLLVSLGTAQDTAYLGLRLSGMNRFTEYGEPLPMVGLQAGARVVGPFGLRLVAETSLFAASLHADLTYTQLLGAGWQGYAGIGADYFAHAFSVPNDPDAYYGAHLTAGAEYRSGIAGFFAEAQPIYAFTFAALRWRLGFGVNFYLF